MIRLRPIWALYRMEVRGALRDRTIVVGSLLIPLLLYPFMLWVMMTGIGFVKGQQEAHRSRLLVRSWPEDHAELRRRIETDQRLRLVSPAEPGEAAAELRDGRLDAELTFAPAEGAARALQGNLVARVTYDASKEESVAARDRLAGIVARYRDEWLGREAARLGIDPARWRVFTLDSRNAATGRQMGALLLSMMLPLLFGIMVLVGGIYPAIDTTAGERERGSFETLLAAPVARSSVVIAKYLYVASFAFLGGVLNLASMALTGKQVLAPLTAGAGIAVDLTPRPAAFLLGPLAALLIAGIAAAGMMLLAMFARTYKDGQSMVMPFYLLAMLPMLFLQGPGVRLDTRTALIPVANAMLLLRDAIGGEVLPLAAALTVVVSLVSIAALGGLAVFVLRFEDVTIGSYQGNLARLVWERLRRRTGQKRSRWS